MQCGQGDRVHISTWQGYIIRRRNIADLILINDSKPPLGSTWDLDLAKSQGKKTSPRFLQKNLVQGLDFLNHQTYFMILKTWEEITYIAKCHDQNTRRIANIGPQLLSVANVSRTIAATHISTWCQQMDAPRMAFLLLELDNCSGKNRSLYVLLKDGGTGTNMFPWLNLRRRKKANSPSLHNFKNCKKTFEACTFFRSNKQQQPSTSNQLFICSLFCIENYHLGCSTQVTINQPLNGFFIFLGMPPYPQKMKPPLILSPEVKDVIHPKPCKATTSCTKNIFSLANIR